MQYMRIRDVGPTVHDPRPVNRGSRHPKSVGQSAGPSSLHQRALRHRLMARSLTECHQQWIKRTAAIEMNPIEKRRPEVQ